MVKGSNRKMFRKPGMARRAIGILASSPELAQVANRNMPVRLQGGGDPLFEQARQQARYMLSRPNVSYGMNEDQMTQSIYQNLLRQNQPISRTRPESPRSNLTRQEQINQTIQSIFGPNFRGPEQFTPAGAFDTRARQAAGQDFVSRNPATSTDTQPFALDSNLEDQRSVLEMSDQELRTRQAELLSELKSLEDRPGGKRKDPLTRQGVQEELNQISVALKDIKARQTALDSISSGDDSGIRGAIEFGDVDRTEAMGDKMLADLAKRKTAGMERSEGVGETLRGIGRFFAPSSERLEKLEADRKSFLEALERGRLFDEVEGMVDSDVLMEQVTADRVKRLDQEVKDKFDINFEDIVSPSATQRRREKIIKTTKERVSPTIEDPNAKLERLLEKEADLISQDKPVSRGLRNQINKARLDIKELDEPQEEIVEGLSPVEKRRQSRLSPDQKKEITEIEAAKTEAEEGLSQIILPNAGKDSILNLENAMDLYEKGKLSADSVSYANVPKGKIQVTADGLNELLEETDNTVTEDNKDTAKGILADMGQPPELADRPDFWHYVTMTGLGIAAGESDNALTNVAKGLLMGLDQKTKEDKEFRKEGYDRWFGETKLKLMINEAAQTDKRLEIAEIRARTAEAQTAAQTDLALARTANLAGGGEKERQAAAFAERYPGLDGLTFVLGDTSLREELSINYGLGEAIKKLEGAEPESDIPIATPIGTILYEKDKDGNVKQKVTLSGS